MIITSATGIEVVEVGIQGHVDEPGLLDRRIVLDGVDMAAQQQPRVATQTGEQLSEVEAPVDHLVVLPPGRQVQDHQLIGIEAEPGTTLSPFERLEGLWSAGRCADSRSPASVRRIGTRSGRCQRCTGSAR